MIPRFAIPSLAIAVALSAARAEEASIYKPQSALQSTPMRVEVIDAASFETSRRARSIGFMASFPVCRRKTHISVANPGLAALSRSLGLRTRRSTNGCRATFFGNRGPNVYRAAPRRSTRILPPIC